MRSAGALVVLRAGVPLVWFDPRGHHLVTFDAAGLDADWPQALAALVATGQLRSVEVRKVDGNPVAEAPEISTLLRQAGFADGYRGPVLRS